MPKFPAAPGTLRQVTPVWSPLRTSQGVAAQGDFRSPQCTPPSPKTLTR